MTQPITGAGQPLEPSAMDDTAGARRSEAPLREVLATLWQNGEKLLRQEVALARAELETKTHHMKTEVAAAAVGGAVLYVGVLALAAAAILLLATVMAPWVAALLVGVIAALAGMFLLKRHPAIDASDAAPERTVRSIEDDVHTFKEAVK